MAAITFVTMCDALDGMGDENKRVVEVTSAAAMASVSEDGCHDHGDDYVGDTDAAAANDNGNIQLGYCVPFDDVDHWRQGAHRSVDWRNDWDGGQCGGVPVWLDPQHVPKRPLRCRNCGKESKSDEGENNEKENGSNTMHFVCQLYAPQETPHAFHRTLYVFACSTCRDGIRVLRTQLPKINPYWPDRNVDDGAWTRHLPTSYHKNGLCVVCGFPAQGRCPLQQQSFCGRHHQRLYKKHARLNGDGSTSSREGDAVTANNESDAAQVNDATTADDNAWRFQTKSTLPGVYNAMEIVVEGEPDLPSTTTSDQYVDSPHVQALFPTKSSTGEDDIDDKDDNDDDEDLEQDDLNEILTGKTSANGLPSLQKLNDAAYQRFVDRITERPNVKEQVLRYNCSWPRSTSTGTATSATDAATSDTTLPSTSEQQQEQQPLWIRHDHQPTTIPPCPHCGSPRQFEFQLMPQLLHYLVNESLPSTKGSGNGGGVSGSGDKSKATTPDDNDYAATVAALQQTESLLQQAPPETVSPHLIESRNAAVARMRASLLGSSSTSSQSGGAGLNWGVVAVYSCTQSCSDTSRIGTSSSASLANGDCDNADTESSLGSYREEYAWVQPSIDSA